MGTAPIGKRYWKPREVMAYTGMAYNTLTECVKAGVFPAPVRLTRNTSLFDTVKIGLLLSGTPIEQINFMSEAQLMKLYTTGQNPLDQIDPNSLEGEHDEHDTRGLVQDLPED